jgi:light-regulated signal transduction histidine kinase (bacteriophytochrome)
LTELEVIKSQKHYHLEQQKALSSVIYKIRESLDLDSLFKATAKEVRQLLGADRVGMYQFIQKSGYNCGQFVSEDVVAPYPSAIGEPVEDHCFGEKYVTYYQHGKVLVTSDIYDC